ncbi:hypothetical protein F6A13_08195 [Acidithiobacillus sp. 'AMD consortium']|uniref:Uncharacterized protein n=1 Tax=Acidithiobacillus ferridurans TaxID=1232575 RepID=A0A8X8GBL9_ACIFI|nr:MULTISPECIES: hypothetical protein [Acidithiobacillus]MBU2715195.1 hypothetical protein [Acidithiobacillus ferridurans]MBU2721998.1 hypothetical protein [Acidithiobacillus ferridurans]MBU2727484.1 hypothetical protein [Acidithiobacillus ferridurans]QFG78624.1 hypothetical protein F6A13_08195 [Acidithiobacillus sp. 'AMD consortium']
MNDDDEHSKIVPIAGNRKPPNAGMGRRKGVPNRTTASLKNMITGALDELGGQAWLVEQARQDPRAFMALLSRLIPSEIKAEVSVNELSESERLQRFNALLERARTRRDGGSTGG